MIESKFDGTSLNREIQMIFKSGESIAKTLHTVPLTYLYPGEAGWSVVGINIEHGSRVGNKITLKRGCYLTTSGALQFFDVTASDGEVILFDVSNAGSFSLGNVMHGLGDIFQFKGASNATSDTPFSVSLRKVG
jgi:hypothetical protein